MNKKQLKNLQETRDIANIYRFGIDGRICSRKREEIYLYQFEKIKKTLDKLLKNYE